jgi:hypothetical protein
MKRLAWVLVSVSVTLVTACRTDGSRSPSSNRLGVAWNPTNGPTGMGSARGGGPPSPAQLPSVGGPGQGTDPEMGFNKSDAPRAWPATNAPARANPDDLLDGGVRGGASTRH